MAPVKVKDRLTRVIEFLPEAEQELLLEIACRFISDDVATPEDIKDILTAREEYARGEYYTDADINWD